jgi:hypothetical protein
MENIPNTPLFSYSGFHTVIFNKSLQPEGRMEGGGGGGGGWEGGGSWEDRKLFLFSRKLIFSLQKQES